MGELQITFEEIAGRIDGAIIKGRQIEHVRRLRDRTRGASEVADRAETALIENVGRVRRDHELAGVMRRIVALDAQDVEHLADENLRSEEHTSELQSLMRIS